MALIKCPECGKEVSEDVDLRELRYAISQNVFRSKRRRYKFDLSGADCVGRCEAGRFRKLYGYLF